MTAVAKPINATVEKPSYFSSAKEAVKAACYIIAADFIVLTIIVGNLIKGAQGVGIFSVTSAAIKQALGLLGAARATYEGIEAAIKASQIFSQRAALFEQLQKPNTAASLKDRVKALKKSCNYVQQNSKPLHKSMKIEKSVKLGERANQILKDLASRDKEKKAEAVKKGEEFVKTLRRRVNLQFGFALGNVVTRVGALATAIALLVSATNPVALALTGVVGLGILVVIVGQKIMLPSNPFDEPDKESKLQTIAFKIRTAINGVLDKIEFRAQAA
ncbi:MAG: hypothetical protein JSR37_07070 [Verrucomicrobia bacterium]|nr:hypothetical protein [Verrucomicrobiota bacterium]MBS0637305.1 hypothetical protein [Verrucomicrobiota bacterium]